MSNLESILYVVLVILIFLVAFLCIVFVFLKAKEKNAKTPVVQTKGQPKELNDQSNNNLSIKIAKEYEPKSIFEFMEFEDVKDNMIIQKKGKRFLMAIECKGVNYDLMSEVEKTSTEHGFAAFLNSLKEPIQIYIQTRTVNLEKNILDYKTRLTKIKDSIELKEYRLKQYLEKEHIADNVIKSKQFELIREKNLYDYGRDIIIDTERMSLNKNVLKKKYYIIIKYFYEPTDADGEELLSKEEIIDLAFSNLYTKAASIVRILSGIGIEGKTLNSYELVDLLYNAYNRDDSEVFGIEKALEAGFNEVYVDAQNVIDKKIAALNREIELMAERRANSAITKIEDERTKELEHMEENIEDIIADLAKKMLEDENIKIPEDVRKKAIKEVDKNTNEKGEKVTNGKKETTKTTRRNRAS